MTQNFCRLLAAAILLCVFSSVGVQAQAKPEEKKAAAAERFDRLELNLAITAVPTDDSGIPDLTLTRAYEPGKSDDGLLDMPSVLGGSPRHIADALIERRERYGVSYFTVQDYHGLYFAQVINALR